MDDKKLPRCDICEKAILPDDGIAVHPDKGQVHAHCLKGASYVSR